jgi:hypothetical protein
MSVLSILGEMVILFDQFNLPENIFSIVFATEQQAIVAKLLFQHMKANNGVIGKTEMSMFATNLHEGKTEIMITEGPAKRSATISYNKRQFYDRILTPMKSMGMIDYDLYKKHYSISDKFNRMLIKIGLGWLREIR